MERQMMNPYTGTVQTETEWLTDIDNSPPELVGAGMVGLIEVVKDANGDWIEAE